MKDVGNFFDAQTAEITKLDDAALTLVDGGKVLERAIEGDQIDGRRFPGVSGYVDHGHLPRPAATLPVTARAGVVDQHAPHQTGRDADEMGPVIPGDVAGSQHFD